MLFKAHGIGVNGCVPACYKAGAIQNLYHTRDVKYFWCENHSLKNENILASKQDHDHVIAKQS